MKKILFLVILIAQSAYMTFAQNETLTFKEIGTHVESSYRSGSTVYFIYPVTEYKINCGSKTPTEIQICDGISTAAKHVVMVQDTTFSPDEHVLTAYQNPGQFVMIGNKTILFPKPAVENLGLFPLQFCTTRGIVYDKNSKQCFTETRTFPYFGSSTTQQRYLFLGVLFTVIIVVSSALLLFFPVKNYVFAKWFIFSAMLWMMFIMLMNYFFNFSMHEQAKPFVIWVCICINMFIFASYIVLDKKRYVWNINDIRVDVLKRIFVLISLCASITMYHGFVGVKEITLRLAELAFITGIIPLIIYLIGLVYKWYCKKYPNHRFVRFMKV